MPTYSNPFAKYQGNENAFWSADHALIINIHLAILRYGDSLAVDDLPLMYNALTWLEVIIAPYIEYESAKMSQMTRLPLEELKKDNPIKKNLDWLEKNFDSYRVFDEMGREIGINPKNRFIVKNMVKTTFKLMIIHLENIGIYTQKVVDAKQAMGRFKSS